MRALDQKRSVTAANGWGRDSTTYQQTFEIEESDVGRPMDDYLGHGHRRYTIARADVGRKINVMTHPSQQRDGRSYRCWSFCLETQTNGTL